MGPGTGEAGGRVYASPATAFLAARTLDEAVRGELVEAREMAAALRLARQAPERPDWYVLRDQVTREVLRVAYRGERGGPLVRTLPFLLADAEQFHPVLEGLQGWPGLAALSHLRGDLATQAARERGRCCLSCRFASGSPWPGFVRCGHPQGVEGTLGCVGHAAVQGPGGAALVPVTTPAGPGFRSEQSAHRP